MAPPQPELAAIDNLDNTFYGQPARLAFFLCDWERFRYLGVQSVPRWVRQSLDRPIDLPNSCLPRNFVRTEEPMKGSRPRCLLNHACVALLLGVLMAAAPIRAQVIKGPIGPVTNAEIVGAFIGILAVGIVTPIVIVHELHKHHRVAGCVESDSNGLSIMDKHGTRYILSGESSSLRSGERVMLKGNKTKDSAGLMTFRVRRLEKDYGACKP